MAENNATETAVNHPDLRLDEDHRYWFGSEELWGVSAVLLDNRLVDPSWFDEKSRSRGVALHADLANVARGGQPFSFIDPDLYLWRQSGIDFLAMVLDDGGEILGVEEMHYHPLYKFAGTIDLRVRWRGYIWIFDLKSGKAAKATRFQLAAYALMVPSEDRQIKRAAVELDRDGGRAVLREYNSLEYFHDGNTFLAFLTASRARQEFAPKKSLKETA